MRAFHCCLALLTAVNSLNDDQGAGGAERPPPTEIPVKSGLKMPAYPHMLSSAHFVLASHSALPTAACNIANMVLSIGQCACRDK